MSKKKYPSSVYSGISPESEDSWGMCCSYEAACRCAEEHYDLNRRDTIKSICKIVPIIAILLAGFIWLMNFEMKLEKEAMENALAACSYCHQAISPEHNYVEFNHCYYHVGCFEKSFQGLRVIPREVAADD